jgi:hypothetical protein
MQYFLVRIGIIFEVTVADRVRLEVVVKSGNTLQKHVWHAWIIILSAQGSGLRPLWRGRVNRRPAFENLYLALAGAVYD